MRLFHFLILGKTTLGRGKDEIGTFDKLDENDEYYDISHLARGQDKTQLPMSAMQIMPKPLREHKQPDMSEFLRGWLNVKHCLKTDNIEGPIENGNVVCGGKTPNACQVKCKAGYHWYGGPPKVRCKKSASPDKGPHWSAKPAQCKTCDPLVINDTTMKKKCKILDSGIKRCIMSCAKGAGILPINKRRAISLCKCKWRDSYKGIDKSGKCHWRLGKTVIDDVNTEHYSGNWTCNNPEPTEQTIDDEKAGLVLDTRPIVGTTTTPKPFTTTKAGNFRIPANLSCEADSRIIGGVDAYESSWPWIVRIKFRNFHCGGTILNQKTVITAAHCCEGFEKAYLAKYIDITSGEYDVEHTSGEEFTTKAEEVIIHPNYSRRTLENDICIVKTLKKLPEKVHGKLSNVCLPGPDDHPEEGTMCWAAGWGKVDTKNSATKLQEVDLKIISDKVCDGTRNRGQVVEGKMFCAGYLEGGKDGCQGDSGGPLICAVNDRPVLVGITSWGYGCAAKNSPGVWTKVASYQDWIDSNIAKVKFQPFENDST